MNHLESVFNTRNNLWRYVLMIAIIFVVMNTVGSVPLIVSIFLNSGKDLSVFSKLAESSQSFSLSDLDPNLALFVMVFPFLAGIFTFMVLIKPFHNRSFSITVNGTGKIRWKRFFISALVWMGLQAVYLFIYLKADPGNFTLNNTGISLIVLIVISLLIIPFQASFEELIFRGYFMQGFAILVKNRWFPLIITSLSFALLHSFNPEVEEYGFLTMMPQYLIFGLLFGVITIVDDGIESAMGAHTANNIFICIMVTQKSAALQTSALYEQHEVNPWTDFLGLFLCGIIFFFILKGIFRWGNLSLIAGKIAVNKGNTQIV